MAGVVKSIERLDVDNYRTWSKKMKAVLVTKELWTPVTEDEPTDKKADQKALALITLSVTNLSPRSCGRLSPRTSPRTRRLTRRRWR